jgi:hypothetical protein
MALLWLVRSLRRHRLSLTVGAIIAAAAALYPAYRVTAGFPPALESRKHDAGFASVDVLVDSAVTQIAYLGDNATAYGSAADLQGLVTRAHLLAGLMATSPLQDQIAAAAGVDRRRLVVVPPTGLEATTGTSETPDFGPQSSVLNLAIDSSLPKNKLRARAPTAGAARRLAGAAQTRLADYVGAAASEHDVPGSQRLAISPMGKVSSATIVVGPRRILTLAVFVVLLGLWSIVILTRPLVATYWRQVASAQSGA